MRAALLTLTVLFLTPALSAQTQNVTLWHVTKHVDTSFTQTDLDARLRIANEAVRLDNEHCDDHPCQLNIDQLDEMGEFGTSGDGLDTVSSDSEMDSAMGTPGRVTVVTSISYCGGNYNESIIGCGQCSGNNFVVESSARGAAWVHEFGHNQQDLLDCGHRNSCVDNLMNAELSAADSLSTSECAMLSGINAHEWCGEMIMLSEPVWFNWVTCPVYLPPDGPWNGVFVTKPFDEWQFRSGTTLTSDGDFSTPGGIVHMYSNSADKGLPGFKLHENGRLGIKNGGQIRLD